jgi:tetratricopeptide (TPR) repeat protein
MRNGRARWLLVAWAVLLSMLGAAVVNLATNLELPTFTKNPWVVGSALVAVWLLSIPVTLRLTASADQAQVLSLVGRVGLLAASARLPADPTPLLGRDTELAALRGHFLAPGPAGPRIAVLSGPPGVGKSALAVHLAHRLAREVDRRAVYADLGWLGAGQRDPVEVLGSFLHALRVPDEAIPAGLEERAALYQSRLGDRRALVVLDNAADVDQVRLLLPEGPRSWALVTSRARLATLPGAFLVELAVLPEPAAVTLLGALAGPERVAADRQAAEEVARACGCLPLALRIAAARLRSRPAWTMTTLAGYLADRRRRLARLKVENLEVRASVALSYDELPEASARMFGLLGLLAGPEVTVEVAAALTGDDPMEAKDALEALVDAQLLEVVEPSRYRLHDLLDLFAQELAAALPVEEQRAVLERAVGWLAARAAQASRLLGDESSTDAKEEAASAAAAHAFADPAAALAWLVAERANLVAAVQMAFEQRLYPLAWQLASSLEIFFELRGYWSEWHDTQTIAVQAARAAGNRTAEAAALNRLGTACRTLRRFDEAIEHYQQALAIRRQLGNRRGEGGTLNNLGRVYNDLHRLDQALDCYQQALAIHREVGERRFEAITLQNLGGVYTRLRRFDTAIGHYQQALTIRRQLKDRRCEGGTLHDLGMFFGDLRRFDAAIDHFQQALAISREVGDRGGEGTVAVLLGEMYEAQRRLDKAMLLYEQALRAFEERADRHGQGMVLAKMGDLARRQRQRGKAISFHTRSLAIFQELNDRHRQDWALMTLAELAREQGRLEDAAAYEEQRQALSQEPGSAPPS